MTGPIRRAVDPADTVRNDLLRRRGVLTQADVQQVRRAVSRVGTLGDTPHHDLEGPLNVTGDLTVTGSNDDAGGLLTLDQAGFRQSRDGTLSFVILRGDDATKVVVVDTVNLALSLTNAADFHVYTDDRTTEVFFVDGSNGHVVTGGGTPGIAVGAAAGTGASAAVVGNDTAGRIQVTTGTSPGTGTLASVTFAASFGSATPAVLLFSADADAAVGAAKVYVDSATISATGFDLKVTGSALPPSTSHFWFFLAFGR